MFIILELRRKKRKIRNSKTSKLHQEFEASLGYIRPYLKRQKQKSPCYQDSLKVNETCTMIKLFIPDKHRNPTLFCKNLTTLWDSEIIILFLALFWVLTNCLRHQLKKVIWVFFTPKGCKVTSSIFKDVLIEFYTKPSYKKVSYHF